MARRAVGDPHVAFEFPLAPVGLRLGIEPGSLGEESFPFAGMRPLGIPAFHAHRELHPLVRAEHQRFVLLFCKILDRRESREAIVPRQRSEVLAPEPVDRIAVRGDGAVGNTPLLVRDDEVRIELHLHAEAMALLTGAERAVEREHPRLEFLKSHPADRARHEGRVRGLHPVPASHENKTL